MGLEQPVPRPGVGGRKGKRAGVEWGALQRETRSPVSTAKDMESCFSPHLSPNPAPLDSQGPWPCPPGHPWSLNLSLATPPIAHPSNPWLQLLLTPPSYAWPPTTGPPSFPGHPSSPCPCLLLTPP